MDRWTRPGIDAEETAVRFMDGEVRIQDIGDKLLDLILNGPTINGIKKDTLRHLVRQLYNALKAYEDTEIEPEELTGMLRSPVYIAACVLNGAAITHERAIEIAKAEVEGRLMVLPCKVGDTIYAIPSKVNRKLNVINRHPENNRVYTQTVNDISFFPDGVYLLRCIGGLQVHHSLFFRETWFLTREEAEAALAKDNNVHTKEEDNHARYR